MKRCDWTIGTGSDSLGKPVIKLCQKDAHHSRLHSLRINGHQLSVPLCDEHAQEWDKRKLGDRPASNIDLMEPTKVPGELMRKEFTL